MSTQLIKKFLAQFIHSPEVLKAEPMLCTLAGRLLLLIDSRNSAATPTVEQKKNALLLFRKSQVVKSEMLEAIKKNQWADVSILAAELDLKSRLSNHGDELVPRSEVKSRSFDHFDSP